MTNTGSTTIIGNIGLSPGTSYSGSGSVSQTGMNYIGDEVAARAQADLTTLYGILAARPTSSGGNLTGQDLGGQTLLPGVYNFYSTAGLASGQTLTLDGNSDPDFIFNIGTSLTTLSDSTIELVNQAQGGNVFFRVGSSATIGTDTILSARSSP